MSGSEGSIALSRVIRIGAGLRKVTALTILSVGLATGLLVGTASGGVTCTKYVSTSGSDAAAGSSTAPYRTIAKLVSSLSAGQTGCLKGGTYGEYANVTKGGVAGSPIVLRSAPGELATLTNNVYFPSSAHDVTLSHVRLTGTSAGQAMLVQIFGSRVTLSDSDISASDRRHTCILVDGGVSDVVIQANKIHNCGVPNLNIYEHGVYLGKTSRTKVVSNTIYANRSGYAIHLWKNADDSLIANNIVHGNRGGIFVGGSSNGEVSERNVVRDNVVTWSVDRNGISSYWGSTPGSGNVLQHNCLWKNNVLDVYVTGFTQSGAVIADPLYVNAAGLDFRLASTSPCAGMGPAGSASSSPGGSSSPPSPSGSGTTASTLSVKITNPVKAQTVRGTVQWEAVPSAPVSKVQFYRGGTLVGTETAAPYRLSWDTRKVSNSYHTLKVVAYGTTGTTAQHSIYVKVAN
jgi:parallel beta-helix repeat protein